MASRNCESCGKSAPKGRPFCGNCGAAMPPAEPRKPIGRKTIGAVVGALVGVGALIAAYFVFFPAPITDKDLRITLNVPAAEEMWAGDEIVVSTEVKFFSKRELDYSVVVETKNSSTTDWAELTSSTGTYPSVTAEKTVAALQGANEFRVLVYVDGEPKPITTSDEVSVSAKQASLPDKCPTDEINHAWGTTESDTMEEFGSSKVGLKDCTIGLPNSDYIVPITYTESNAKKFTAMKKSKKGKTISLELGETGAFKYWIPANEIGGAYWAYVVNFHSIIIDTEMPKENLGILIDAIVVK